MAEKKRAMAEVAKEAGTILFEQVPGGALTMRLLRKAFPDADEGWRSAFKEEMESMLLDVERRLRALENLLKERGEVPDPRSRFERSSLLDELAVKWAHSYSDTKRDALINAMVRQYDASMGSKAARRSWLQAVAAMPDVEVEVLLLTGSSPEHRLLFRDGKPLAVGRCRWIGGPGLMEESSELSATAKNLVTTEGPPKSTRKVADVEVLRTLEGDVVALRSAAARMNTESPALIEAVDASGRTCRLTPNGRRLVAMCEPIVGAAAFRVRV